MPEEELKPCPFCGGEGQIGSNGGCIAFYVFCIDCPAVIKLHYSKAPREAIEAWNRRV